MTAFASSPLVQAIKRQSPIEDVFALLDTTPNEVLVQTDEQSGAGLLFYAVQRKPDSEALEILKYLCESRNVCKAELIDYNGQTALFFAARDGNAECVKYLVKQGCNPHLQDSADQTALFYACRDGRTQIARLLVEEMEVAINSQDKVGQTALFYAARDGQLETVKYMLSEGADASIRDWQKKTAHSYAQKKGHFELAAFLKSAARTPERHSSSKSRHRQAPVSALAGRMKARLQYAVQLPDGSEVWLLATGQKVEEFEQQFPSVAAWTHLPCSPEYQPADAFRVEWTQKALQILDLVSNYHDGWLFKKAVDTKAWNCPDYYEVIKEPRDFSTIKKKLRGLGYASVHTFVRDMELVFSNCLKYNPESTQVHQAGQRVHAFWRSIANEYRIEDVISQEDGLVHYLKAHSLPISIGPEAELMNQPPPAAERGTPGIS